MKTYWVSMAAEDGTARVVLLDAIGEGFARLKLHRDGFYRDGDQVLILELPESFPEHGLPRNRVLTPEELQSVARDVWPHLCAQWPDEPWSVYERMVLRVSERCWDAPLGSA